MTPARRRCLRLAVALAAPLLLAAPAATQETSAEVRSPAGFVVPNFWDPAHREERPDLAGIRTIRFLTESQAPPFSFVGADGLLTGFHVEIARAVCLELEVACTIQPMRWDLLRDGLRRGMGDAIVAGIAMTPDSRERYDFSHRFLSRPARFAVRADSGIADISPGTLSGRRVAVVRDTAHAAYLADLFPDVDVVRVEGEGEARSALIEEEVDAVFGDGLNLSLWLNGAGSRGCCRFAGGPYTEARYFGEGNAIAVARGNDTLRQAFDYALMRAHLSGRYGEIYRRYFPISFY